MDSEISEKNNMIREYRNIRKNLEEDINDVVLIAKNIINSDIQYLIDRCKTSVDINKNIICDSVDSLCHVVNNAFENLNYKKQNLYSEKVTNVYENKNFEANNNVESSEISSKISKRKSYCCLINEIASNSSDKIAELALAMTGKLYVSCSIRDKKPRRLWNWNKRIEYIRGIIEEGNFSSNELKSIEHLRVTLQKHSYLKAKKPEYLCVLNDCLKRYNSLCSSK
jgi:hypothetical protein